MVGHVGWKGQLGCTLDYVPIRKVGSIDFTRPSASPSSSSLPHQDNITLCYWLRTTYTQPRVDPVSYRPHEVPYMVVTVRRYRPSRRAGLQGNVRNLKVGR